jgi:nitrogenase molybdenum-iron protein beta chain
MCAIGAMQTVVAIPRAMPVLHSGPGCGTMVAGFFERSGGYLGGSTAPCTNFSETETVFGGTKKLEKLIRQSEKILDSDLQVILPGCASAIIGDDIEEVARRFVSEGKPVVFANVPGFKYSNYEAHSIVVNAIIDQYTVHFENGTRKNPKQVNLFATLPYQDQFWKGNLEELGRLLEGIGLEVQMLFGPRSGGVTEWRNIPQANFNILVSPWAGTEIVEHLKEKYDQEYFRFPCLPVGGNESTRFLRGVLAFANDHGAELDAAAAERFISAEERVFYEEIDNLAAFLLEFRYGLPRYVHILHDASYVLGMSEFLLHETGLIPKEQYITDNTPQAYQAEIRALAGEISAKKEIPVYFYADAGRAQEHLRSLNHEGRGLVIGSGWDKDLANEKGCDFLSAALPGPYRMALTTGYAGYRGGLRLVEDIYNTALNSYR